MERATTSARQQRRRDPARLLCAFSRHLASDQTILNDGYHFSRCSRCDADLVEVEGGWSAAPRGYRIVWKSEIKPAPAPADEAGEEAASAPGEAASIADEETPALVEPAVEPAPAGRLEPVHQERRRLDRRVNPYAFAYKGKERRRNRDRRNNFGRKTDAV